jgi:DedD protein
MSIIRVMDRSLKARLIGATVLVLLVVLVVPELLSGRKSGSAAPTAETASGQTRTYTIELAGDAPPATAHSGTPNPSAPAASPLAAERPARAPRQTDAATSAPAPRKAPATPAGMATTEPETATGAAPTITPPAPRTPPPTATEPATPGRGTWSVQVGAFGSAESARRLVGQLEADGFDAYVSTARREGKTLHRVRVGPEPGRAQADSLAGRLKARGLPVSVVAND